MTSEIYIGEGIKIIALFFSITGAIYTAKKERKKRFFGFFCWYISNFLWLITAIYSKDLIMAILWLFYLYTTITGIFNNSKNE